MTPNRKDDEETGDPFDVDETTEPQSTHWFSILADLLDSLDRPSRPSETGRSHPSERGRSRPGERGRSRPSVDVRVSIGSIGDVLDATRDYSSDASARSDVDAVKRTVRPRVEKQSTNPVADRVVVTSRRYDDEVLVVADVSDIDRDSITIGMSDTTLVVAVEGQVIERIDAPWSSVTTAAHIANDVLTVRIEPDQDADDRESSGNPGDRESTDESNHPTESDRT